LNLSKIVLRILGSPRVVEIKRLWSAGLEGLKVIPALPWEHFFRDKAHRPFRRLEIGAVSSYFAKRGKQQRRCCCLRVEVAELGPWLQVSVIPGGNDAAGKLVLHKEVAIRAHKRQNLFFSIWSEILA